MKQLLNPIAADKHLWDEFIPGGGHWSFKLRRGLTLRITDLHGGANVSAMFYHAKLLSERYSMADSLKAQHTAHFHRGHVLMSDMGRVLCSISDDSLGWHDPLSGITDAAWVKARYGERPYQTHRNAMYQNARDGMLLELAKWGLGARDLQAPLNLFSKVLADEEGQLALVPGFSQAGDAIDLRCEMDTVIVLGASQHPLDLQPTYSPKPVKLTVWDSGPAAAEDICRGLRPENARALTNTERFYA